MAKKKTTKTKKKEELFVVRLYDGFDNQWIDVSGAVPRSKAEDILSEKTCKGTKNTNYGDIDYYKIFPANSRMLYSDGFGAKD
ncbi:MAG: hypothetical protein OIN85_01145 [Candidatus Methanoperedens sp.]|nr:hypothetical protein [Candidatus Methanoperedens sp.]